MLKETDPETFWQSRHYEGNRVSAGPLSSEDPDRVRDVIEQAHDQRAAMKPVRTRKK